MTRAGPWPAASAVSAQPAAPGTRPRPPNHSRILERFIDNIPSDFFMLLFYFGKFKGLNFVHLCNVYIRVAYEAKQQARQGRWLNSTVCFK